ncbi:hypothetical protein [Streptomyces coeruleorubidus]
MWAVLTDFERFHEWNPFLGGGGGPGGTGAAAQPAVTAAGQRSRNGVQADGAGQRGTPAAAVARAHGCPGCLRRAAQLRADPA